MRHVSRHLRKFMWLLSKMLIELVAGRPKTIVFTKSDWESSLRRFETFFRHKFAFADDPSTIDPKTVDFIIPLSSESYEKFINAPLVSSLVLAPSEMAAHVCNDKAAFHAFFVGCSAELIPRRDTGEFPCIVKPVVGANSDGCEIIWNEKEWSAFQQEGRSDYVSEEYVPGRTEYASHVLANNGRIIDILCIEYVFEETHPMKGRAASYRRIVSERFPHVIQRFLRKLSYTGFCCVNYKIRNNSPVIFEINPRVGGSCCEYLFGFVRHLHKIDRLHGTPG